VEVIGVVNTAKVRSLGEDPRPVVYVPPEEGDYAGMWLVARTAGDAEGTIPQMLRLLRETEPDAYVVQSRTLARHVEIMSLPLRLGAGALAGFALLALAMASVGLFGSVSYAVAQRSREVGIRLAIGADRAAVVRLLLWGGLRLVLAGAVAGLGLALLLAQLLEGLLFGVPARDPTTFVAVPLVLLAVAFLAAYLPARRAGRVSPVSALRSD
jgi:cell division protein FtsX